MNCPKCDSKMRVTHSYSVESTSTQRLECPGCRTIATAATVLVAINPGYGQGAASLAKRLSRQETRVAVSEGSMRVET